MFFHGNLGNISQRDYVIKICENFELNLFLIDYQGFGKSDNYTTPTSILDDAVTSYKFLQKRFGDDKIIIWGESLGGYPAIYTALKFDCKSLILLCTFASLDDVIKHQKLNSIAKSTLRNLFGLCFDHLDNKEFISDVKCPIAIIHSRNDKMINYKNAKTLYNSINHSCKTLITIDGDHSSPIFEEYQIDELFEFMGISITSCMKVCYSEIIQDLKTASDVNFG